MSFYSVFCKGKRGGTKQPDLDHIELPEASSRKWWKCSCGLGAARGSRTRGPNNNYSLELIMFNNHFTRTLSVLTSARVFMRRQPIPPLCGGAVQALPNIHTTLRHHPHPASRPMTFGHFTSWPADDRGYYTGVEYTPTEVVKPTFVHPQKLLSLVNPQKLLSLPQNICCIWCIWYMIHMIHMIRTHKIVDHIFRANSWGMWEYTRERGYGCPDGCLDGCPDGCPDGCGCPDRCPDDCPNGFWRFRRARAKKKRMCPAWYYLTGMMALAGAQPLSQKFEKVARKSPFDRNV